MLITSPEKQLKQKAENLELIIFDLQKMRLNLSDELTDAKAFYFFRGHTIETIINKISAIDTAILELNNYQKLINSIR